MSDCIFCNIDQARIIDSDKYFNVILDIYPVTELHTLIIPHRHVSSYFDLTEQEQSSLFTLLKKHKDKLIELAEVLLKDEVIFKDNLETIFGKRPYDSNKEEESSDSKGQGEEE